MLSEIRNEIEGRFALQSGDGAYKLLKIDQRYPAWAIRKGKMYGAFIVYGGEEISESFSGAMLTSEIISIEDEKSVSVLMLTCRDEQLRNQFALICEDFVDPGQNGISRDEIISAPLAWWRKWTALLGNAQGRKMVYDIVGELSAVLKLCRAGLKPYWSASRLNTHDIELNDSSYEVKSTIKKETASIHISSQFQLKSDKPLYLVFTRLEESDLGMSINDLLAEIEPYEPDYISEYNLYIEESGFKYGNHYRKIKYSLLERRLILINDSFPKITERDFIGKRFPSGISHIEYTVELEGLPYTNWE